jgi:hypothetical protein
LDARNLVATNRHLTTSAAANNTTSSSFTHKQSNVEAASFSSLTQHCLESILAFLPDKSFVYLVLTCKACHAALEGGSMGLWRQMLETRGWPYAVEGEEIDRDYARRTFVSHCNVARGARTIASAVYAINKVIPTKGVACQMYENMQNPIEEFESDISLKVWSTKQVLVACTSD